MELAPLVLINESSKLKWQKYFFKKKKNKLSYYVTSKRAQFNSLALGIFIFLLFSIITFFFSLFNSWNIALQYEKGP